MGALQCIRLLSHIYFYSVFHLYVKNREDKTQIWLIGQQKAGVGPRFTYEVDDLRQFLVRASLTVWRLMLHLTSIHPNDCEFGVLDQTTGSVISDVHYMHQLNAQTPLTVQLF